MAELADELEVSGAHLAARLAVLESRVVAALEQWGAPASAGDDRFRGLYLRPDDVRELVHAGPRTPVELDDDTAALLARVEAGVDDLERDGGSTRLRRLQRAFALESIEVELLLLALAPDLDARFERFYAYLHDDVARRRASVGLAVTLAGRTALSGATRRCLGPAGVLVSAGLVLVEEPDRPFLTRSLRVPDRVAAHLLGDDTPDPGVEALLARPVLTESGDRHMIERGIANGERLVYVHEARGAAGASLAAAALVGLGLTPVQLDLRRLPAGPIDPLTVQAAAREAVLCGGALLVEPIEAAADRGADAVRAFAELACCTVLVGARTWDPTWSRTGPLVVRASAPDRHDRAAQWRLALAGADSLGFDPATVTGDLRLAPARVAEAVHTAQRVAAAQGRSLAPADLRLGARAQNAAGLERLAQRIEPAIGWADLVLPPKVSGLVEELIQRWRHRDTVMERWHLGGPVSRRRGLIALFSGPPGTGKTMAAEVVAGEFGLDLYVINVATVVDKYIGETEKNLERVFSEAEQVNGILFFDEADALFGKRSEVKDARDRYANIEIAYLLQRLELFDGIAILATNLKTNLDEAFARRLDVAINFPLPDEAARLVLWQQCLGELVPRSSDVDLGFMATSFELAGGNIRNVAVAAAYFAAARGAELSMADLILATHREYQKLGRLSVEAEFGPWFELMESR